jgi:predicted transcriptional regulator
MKLFEQLKVKCYIYIANLEAMFLDDILRILSDEKPRDLYSKSTDAGTTNKINSIAQRLLDDGYVKIQGNYFEITSQGLSFYQSGGYFAKEFYRKLSRVSVWFSLLAVLISIIAFVRTL